MTTLENLYYGNIAPHEYEVVRGSEYDVTAKLVIRHEQELSATLTEQQNAILQKIKDNHTELMNLGERDAFRRGFSLAVRLMVDAMSTLSNGCAIISILQVRIQTNRVDRFCLAFLV